MNFFHENNIFEYDKLLVCLNCKSINWQVTQDYFACNICNNKYEIKNNKIISTKNFFNIKKWEQKNDNFKLLEGDEKPTLINKVGGPRIKNLQKILKIQGLSINFGSGQDSYENYLNIDLGNYDPVHLVADLTNVPLKSECAELIVCNSVIEHIYDYNKVIDEIYRLISPEKFLYLTVPLNSIRHHQFDYHRWTQLGLKKLLEPRFEILESGSCRGVAYSISHLVEALITQKIRNKLIRKIMKQIWRYCSLPLFLIKDEKTEAYQSISNTIYVIAKKSTSSKI